MLLNQKINIKGILAVYNIRGVLLINLTKKQTVHYMSMVRPRCVTYYLNMGHTR